MGKTMGKKVLKSFKLEPATTRRLADAARARGLPEAAIVRAALDRELGGGEGLDMVAALGGDFGRVRGGRRGGAREKLLAGYGRACA
jgi:hypothetical protein